MLRLFAFCASPFALALVTGADLRLTGGLPLLGYLLFWAAPVPAPGRAFMGGDIVTIFATILMFALVLAAFVVALAPVVS